MLGVWEYFWEEPWPPPTPPATEFPAAMRYESQYRVDCVTGALVVWLLVVLW